MEAYNFLVSYDISDDQNRNNLRSFLTEKLAKKINEIGNVHFKSSVREISESTYNIELTSISHQSSELIDNVADALVKNLYTELESFTKEGDRLFVCYFDVSFPSLSKFPIAS